MLQPNHKQYGWIYFSVTSILYIHPRKRGLDTLSRMHKTKEQTDRIRGSEFMIAINAKVQSPTQNLFGKEGRTNDLTDKKKINENLPNPRNFFVGMSLFTGPKLLVPRCGHLYSFSSRLAFRRHQ